MSSEQKVQYETQGFLHLPGAIDASTLARLARAFDVAAEKYRGEFTAQSSTDTISRKYFDIPRILDQDDVFVDLLELPSVFPVLLEILGGDIQLLRTQARLFPPGKTFTPAWHSDLAHINGIDLSHSLNFLVKVHYYPEDLTPEQGCLAFIPGSHRYQLQHPQVRIDHTQPSPAVTKVVPKAGDAILFNVHVLHMALDNTSPFIRKSLIYSYSHFWVKNTTSAIPGDLHRLASTPVRRQLFGIPSQADASPFNETLFKPSIRKDAKDFVSAGRAFLSKAKHLYLNGDHE